MLWWSWAVRCMASSLVAACFEFEFMGGSMGSVVGERFVRGVNAAIEQKVPVRLLHRHGRRPHARGLASA